MNDLSQPVWYASYGSNLSSARFRTYLEGGAIPHGPNGRIEGGARDSSPPSGNMPCQIDRRLVFGGSSPRWGNGGVASLDTDQTPPDLPVLGRAWRITLGQFEDVFRQENRLDEVVTIDLEAVSADGFVDLLPTGYGRLELLGRIDDDPVVTITKPARPDPLRPPHESYLQVMIDGLVETWSLDAPDAARYLAALSEAGGATRTSDPSSD